ncbi:MAG: LegC family aminotransferase [Fimbriimonadaceae bacterium]|nr:LegC family aminotransferase [Alphaproteobacteria bacterium]
MLSSGDKHSALKADILKRVDYVLGDHKRPISLHEPTFGAVERQTVMDCLDSGWVSSAGPFISKFEEEVAKASGATHGVAIVNGTAALHVALLLAGVKPGDEVLVPALTFIATANAVSYLHAVPHFVDASPTTLGVDPTALRTHLEAVTDRKNGQTINRETGRPIRALMPVHVFGHLVDMPGLQDVADQFGLAVVEDATESLGTHQTGKDPSISARMAVVSFNGNKIITTGGGGMILTNDKNLADEARHLTTTAKKPHAWAFDHDRLGFNYRMPNINAALGHAQITRLGDFVAKKRLLAERYKTAFAGCEGASFFEAPAHSVSNYWLNAILLNPKHAELQTAILEEFNAHQIMARPIWTPLNRLAIYQDAPCAKLPVTNDIATRLINLPSSPFLAEPPSGENQAA